ncbi:hypothetical protein M378DRAFT_159863 [Amanita muscaria Koide BX008]|uniref:Uncharacterized protein n=1 Tax=Amanita muscaria (strain Koide BX008) TaxID=946122 RepID=A0A0C2TK87_AMAMK|nr:hypothetical protein M378DRAFT_159863 [Amanita muscaria Koide BX008]
MGLLQNLCQDSSQPQVDETLPAMGLNMWKMLNEREEDDDGTHPACEDIRRHRGNIGGPGKRV